MFLLSKEHIVEWCRGKSWLVRMPVMISLVWLFSQYIKDPGYYGLLNNFDLLMHEAGHLVLMVFGNETLTILGGTLFELGVPIICLLAFLRESNYFGMSFALGWLGVSLYSVAHYLGDARARVLPLLGGNVDGHDWYNLLSRWGLLEYDTLISQVLQAIAGSLMLVAIIFGFWLLWLMYEHRAEAIYRREL